MGSRERHRAEKKMWRSSVELVDTTLYSMDTPRTMTAIFSSTQETTTEEETTSTPFIMVAQENNNNNNNNNNENNQDNLPRTMLE
jgi:hypothetical protein